MPAQREWFEKDYYKVLGVSEKASEKDVTSAYRRLAKKYHPDANPGAEERFKEVSAAYDVLGDPAKRKEYDDVRRLGPAANPFAGARNGAGFGGGFKVDDLGDLLGGLFGRGRATSRSTRPGPRRGDDLEATLNLSFADAIDGVITSVNVTSDAACSTCNGTGAAPGTTPVICSGCGGRGVRDENQGLFSFSQPCRECGGTGMKVEKPCPNCMGSGLERRPRQLKVRVPAGIEDGKRIVLKGRGGAGHNGGPAGDVYVVVRVGQHELFGRKGKDITLTVPVTFAEAALGATIKIPTLGEPVSLKLPAGTRSGRTFRVKGRGAGGETPGGGDLLATVEVVVPDKLTDAQRAAVEALAAASTDSPRRHLGVE
ncbi:MAG TPA: molecular chaperone DnaJ [Acidimicrobiales bacterium]|nr:molecular chaperone DnaJ [Acidimicrobiales bacterium]